MEEKGEPPDGKVSDSLKGHAEVGGEVAAGGLDTIVRSPTQPEGEAEPPPTDDHSVEGDLCGSGCRWHGWRARRLELS